MGPGRLDRIAWRDSNSRMPGTHTIPLASEGPLELLRLLHDPQRGLVFAVVDQLHALLEIAALRLFLFYRLEESFEIALSKRLATSPLYQFEEECRSVLERFGEDLEHVSLLILVDQNAEFLEVVYALADSSHSLRQFCVV